jgi:hypothetical protein
MVMLLKSQKTPLFVIPAKAGIQGFQEVLDSGDPVPAEAGSRGDGFGDFLRGRQWRMINDQRLECGERSA